MAKYEYKFKKAVVEVYQRVESKYTTLAPPMTKKKQRAKKTLSREQKLIQDNELLPADLAFIKKP